MTTKRNKKKIWFPRFRFPVIYLPTEIWWRKYWWTSLIGMAVLIIVLSVALICCHIEKADPVSAPVSAPISAPVSAQAQVVTKVTHLQLLTLLRATFPEFDNREIDRSYYYPMTLSDFRGESQQNAEAEIGFYRKLNEGTVEIVLVMEEEGKIAIYRIDPLERINLIEGNGRVKFP